VVIPVAVVWITWYIKDSVDAALKKREVEVATAAMQASLTKLRAPNRPSEADADASALFLALLGKPSMIPLIREYNETAGPPEVGRAIEKALLMLGLTHPAELCESLREVLGDKGKRFNILTYTLAVRHTRLANCRDNADIIRELKAGLTSGSRIDDRLNSQPQPQELDIFRTEVDNAFNQLVR
jgi:hypothetical protein